MTTNNFDAASRLKAVSDGTNVAWYSYLANSPLVGQISFTNSGALRMTTTKQYDYLNRLTSISNVNAASVDLDSHAYVYNTANQRTAVTNADASYWSYGYDALGQVTNGVKRWSDATLAAGQQFGYAFDNIGNRTATTAGGDASGGSLRSATYGANNLNQYTNRTVPGAVDIIGSATNTATVTVDNNRTYRHGNYYQFALPVTNGSGPVYPSVTNLAVLNRGTNTDLVATNIGSVFVPQATESFGYDADGNLTNDGRWSYTWDGENRLINMTNNANVPSGARMRLDFGYDYQGRRISKAVSLAGVTNTLLRFVYDGWNLTGQLNGTNDAVIGAYMWGSDVDAVMEGGGLLALIAPSVTQVTNAQFVACDANGNVSALLDAGSGAVTSQYEYGPFGELIRATGPLTDSNPFHFAAKYQDDNTGLLYYGYRFYNPSNGRWLSRDAAEEQGGLNLYGFAGNDGLNFGDILGLWVIYDAFHDTPAFNKTLSLKTLLNLPDQSSTFTQVANAVADTIEPAAFELRSDRISFGTTADPTSGCGCVDLQFDADGGLNIVKEALSNGAGALLKKIGINLPTIKGFGGDISGGGTITIHDCKGWSKDQVETTGSVAVDFWAGYNYDLKTLSQPSHGF